MADDTNSTATPTSIQDLKPRMELTGRVTGIDLYGAFVDIGIGQDGLVHISRIRKGPINRVEEALSVGDEVTVYVDRVDTRTNRVSLTMLKPLDVSWNEIKVGNVYRGKISRLEPYGIFVEVGAERPGLVHISELADQHIRHPSELYAIGDHIDVRVINYDKKKRRIDLSLSDEDPSQRPVEDEEDEAESFTAMEFAMRKALNGSDVNGYSRRRPSRHGWQPEGQVQDDILTRTLRSRKP